MQNYLQSVADRAVKFVSTPISRKGAVVMALGGLIALGNVFFWNWMAGRIWGPMVSGLRVLKDEPMGSAGLIVFLTLIGCIVLVFIDTSPTAAMLKEGLGKRRPKALSREDRDQIPIVRKAWKECGMYAGNGLDSLLDQVLDNYARTNPIGGYLYHAQHQLRRTRANIEAAVASDSVQSLEHVRAHLNTYNEAYIYAYGLVEVVHKNGMPLSGDAYKTILEVWQGLHATWSEELVKLYHRPEHGDRLKTFRDVRPPGFLPPTLAVGALRMNATGTITPPPSLLEGPESTS